jgi:hypothetical protein
MSLAYPGPDWGGPGTVERRTSGHRFEGLREPGHRRRAHPVRLAWNRALLSGPGAAERPPRLFGKRPAAAGPNPDFPRPEGGEKRPEGREPRRALEPAIADAMLIRRPSTETGGRCRRGLEPGVAPEALGLGLGACGDPQALAPPVPGARCEPAGAP